MTRRSPKTDVLRALFARSGNRCAFPGCVAALINEHNQLIGQVCHIEAAERGGERFNPLQTDEDRRVYSNLFLLCYAHHVETNDINTYTVQSLREMKAAHERAFEEYPYKIDESLLYKVAFEMEKYWSRVEGLHRNHHLVPELAIEIDVNASYEELSQRAQALANDVLELRNFVLESEDSVYPDLEALIEALGLPNSVLDEHRERTRSFEFRNWEVLNIGFTNTITKLQVTLAHMEIKYLEKFLKLNPHDSRARARMETLKLEFEELATSEGYAD